MNVVSDRHKVALRQWHEELQEKRGLRASLRRSATLNNVRLSEGFYSLIVQTHPLWNTQEKGWRFTALALVAALATQVKTIDDRQTFAAQLGQKTGDTPVMSRLRFVRFSAIKTPDELLRQLRRAVSLLHGSVSLLSLAENIFRWCRGQDDLLNHRRHQQRPVEFIRIRWVLDYYQAGDAE